MAKKITKKTAKKGVKKAPRKSKKTTKLPAKVIKHLEKAGVNHEILEHKTVYTAIDAAATMKKKINEIVKSLLVKADKDYVLVLLPADNNADLDKVGKLIGKHKGKDVKVIKIPGEKIVDNALKVKNGAVTAFGQLHDVLVVMDKKLEKVKKGVFASGSHNHSIVMSIKDYIKMEEPIMGVIGKKKKIKKPKMMKSKRKKK